MASTKAVVAAAEEAAATTTACPGVMDDHQDASNALLFSGLPEKEKTTQSDGKDDDQSDHHLVGLPIEEAATAAAASDLLETNEALKSNDSLDRSSAAPPPQRVPKNGQLQEQRQDDGKRTCDYYERLEDRIEELEVKLSTLSRLLVRQQQQQQQQQQQRATPPVQQQQRCVSPVNYDSSTVATPHLESPAPSLMMAAQFQQGQNSTTGGRKIVQPRRLLLDNHDQDESSPPGKKIGSDESGQEDNSETLTKNDNELPPTSHAHRSRNLSLTLLFDNDEEEYQKRSSAPPTASMTLAERQWLRPKLLQYQQQQAGVNDPLLHEDNEQVRRRQPLLPAEEKEQIIEPVNKLPQRVVSSTITATAETALDTSEDSNKTSSSSSNNSEDVFHKTVRTKWLDYLNSFQESTPNVDVQMEEFIKVPGAVEGIMSFGFCICVDCFLYMLTILPIRFVWSLLLLFIKLFCHLFWNKKRRQSLNPHIQFHRRHMYQLIQVLIISTVYRYVLAPVSIGKLYHWIRGQAMIKLYVIIAMVEIFDRLFSSLGQDCLESMYWNTVSRPQSRRMMVSILVVLVYAAIHTFILFVHVATLNVAMNSADQALLTLLISGNFAEIKSTVFKKYNKAALFKITASDICERFKLGLFLSLVLLLNICQGMDQHQFLAYMRICGFVWCAEVTADWIKHAFITKFNFLPARVYPEYALLLAGDVTGIGHEGVNLDRTHAVVKRIGFAQIPLLCVMFRLLKEAAKYASTLYASSLPDNDNDSSISSSLHWWWMRLLLPFASSSQPRRIMAFVCLWLLLLLVKLALGRLLQRLSLDKLYAAPEFSQLTPNKKKTQ